MKASITYKVRTQTKRSGASAKAFSQFVTFSIREDLFRSCPAGGNAAVEVKSIAERKDTASLQFPLTARILYFTAPTRPSFVGSTL